MENVVIPVPQEEVREVPKRFRLPKFNFKLSLKYRRPLIVFLVILVLLVVIGIFAPFFGRFIKRNITPAETPAPTALPEATLTPSVSTNDPDILGIEEKLGKLDESFSKVNLREDELRPPTLDFNVSFEK